MEAGANFEQTSDAALDSHATGARGDDPREDLEQGAFTCPVVADDSDNLRALNIKRDILQGPKVLGLRIGSRSLRFEERFDP